jgi:hypothetical protein
MLSRLAVEIRGSSTPAVRPPKPFLLAARTRCPRSADSGTTILVAPDVLKLACGKDEVRERRPILDLDADIHPRELIRCWLAQPAISFAGPDILLLDRGTGAKSSWRVRLRPLNAQPRSANPKPLEILLPPLEPITRSFSNRLHHALGVEWPRVGALGAISFVASAERARLRSPEPMGGE